MVISQTGSWSFLGVVACLEVLGGCAGKAPAAPPALSPSDASLLYVSKQGDAMTGSLSLPSNGLLVGTNQLALSNGSVGIGTATPAAPLHVSGSGIAGSKTVAFVGNASTPGMATLVVQAETAGRGLLVGDSTVTPTSQLGYGVQINSIGTGNSIQSYSNVSAETPANFTINPSGGNIGIGTAAPLRLMHLSTSELRVSMIALENTNPTDGASQVISFRAPTTGTGAAAFVEFAAVRSDITVHDGASRASNLLFFTSGAGSLSEKMRIDASGAIGIGTSSPRTTLDVNGAISLRKFSDQPFVCDAGHDGSIALTHVYTTCVCNGSAWVLTANGTSDCSW